MPRLEPSGGALDKFLVDPMAKVPGTLMPIQSADDKTRADVVAYLATLKKEKSRSADSGGTARRDQTAFNAPGRKTGGQFKWLGSAYRLTCTVAPPPRPSSPSSGETTFTQSAFLSLK